MKIRKLLSNEKCKQSHPEHRRTVDIAELFVEVTLYYSGALLLVDRPEIGPTTKVFVYGGNVADYNFCG